MRKRWKRRKSAGEYERGTTRRIFPSRSVLTDRDLPHTLRGNFILGNLGKGAAERLCARQRESHIPKINFRREEFDADVSLAITLALDGSDAAFDLAGIVFVEQNQYLSDYCGIVHFQLRTVLANRIRLHANAEFLAGLILSIDNQWNGQGDPLSAPTFLTTKVK